MYKPSYFKKFFKPFVPSVFWFTKNVSRDIPNKKIKLLHITSSLKMGGAEAVLCDLIKSMNGDKFEHHVIYFHDGPHRSMLQDLGIPTYNIQGVVALYDPLFLLRLYKAIKRIQPDVIHSLLCSANIVSRIIGALLKIPVVSVWHNNVDQDGLFRNLLDRGTLNFAAKLIAVSPGIVQSITAKKWHCAQPILVIQNGVDSAALHKKNAAHQINRSDLGLEDHHYVVGSVGRFVPVKNYDLMLRAFALLYVRHAYARLVLVGVGPLEGHLRVCAQQLGLQESVIFVIGQPAYRYYHLFNCFSLASDKEGISIALLEAMSFRLPCVVTNAESTHAVLEHNVNGLLVPAGNMQDLAAAYATLIQYPQLSTSLGSQARRTVQDRFSHKTMVASYEKAFIDAFF